jgi:hypothetical protein
MILGHSMPPGPPRAGHRTGATAEYDQLADKGQGLQRSDELGHERFGDCLPHHP